MTIHDTATVITERSSFEIERKVEIERGVALDGSWMEERGECWERNRPWAKKVQRVVDKRAPQVFGHTSAVQVTPSRDCSEGICASWVRADSCQSRQVCVT